MKGKVHRIVLIGDDWEVTIFCVYKFGTSSFGSYSGFFELQNMVGGWKLDL
jgi:hypothetical protein